MVDRAWDFWIDRGGTFTDVVARTPSGQLKTLKLLSVDPQRYEDASVAAIERLLAESPPDQRRIGTVKMGTTVATNALLERRGEPTVLVITAGLEDAIRIGGQQRPEIFALDIKLPEMLYTRVIGADERIGADGTVLAPLDTRKLRTELESAFAASFRSVAIVLLHGYRFPQHEAAAAAIAQEIGFSQVSVSHRVLPLPKLVTRGDTTLADAYLSPVLDRYVASVRRGLATHVETSPRLLFMQSHGGLAAAEHFRGKDSLLSGPAGGVIGMLHAARAVGCSEVIGFDMGGTSTDVALYAGELERTTDSVIASVRVSAPMLKIQTVAAGGGSILTFGQGRLKVGPASAGAYPGPACYRHGGPLTVTDANVLLGRIQPSYFPRVFGPSGDEPLDREASHAAFLALAERLRSVGQSLSPEQLANGYLRIAVERMANAIREISVQRGHDITRFTLCCFGGAGGQHAAQVAEALGIATVIIHPLAGVLSAYGIGVADVRVLRQRSVEAALDAALMASLPQKFAVLAGEATSELREQTSGATAVQLERRVQVKVAGTDTPIAVAWQPDTSLADLSAAFAERHERQFGFRVGSGAALAVESLELEAVVPGTVELPPGPPPALPPGEKPKPVGRANLWTGEFWRDVPVYDRAKLPAGTRFEGPALIVETHATTVVEPGWVSTVHESGTVVLTRIGKQVRRESHGRVPDPIMLEVFNNLFMHVAEEMGIVLERTAHSVNIKERLDFSCAVFDSEGMLIANAPHIPVHLGSMSDSVQSIIRSRKLAPGDSYLLNTPYNGGTHLPDMTVVTPVFDKSGKDIRYFVASRAHHADIGGITPGSMPPGSRAIDEEGVLFDGVRIVAAGELLEADVRAVLASGRWPARNPDQNIADLKAQLAANARGIAELARLLERFGIRTVERYMGHVQNNAALCVRAAIERLRDGRFTVELDSGEKIDVAVRIAANRRNATVDFTGTSGISPGNFNAPTAIVRAAVLYVFRTLVRESIPLNAGCMEPLDIVLPDDSLLNPKYPAAVVAGNVETSQCITDALLAAVDACAASQGTMNNFTFGNSRHQYYETLCGGAGAGPGFDGASAVHTHMTNSRLTDPEVLEQRYPVRVKRFAIRVGSGGAGHWRGGDGVVREIEFLEPMQAAILSNRRRVPPFGLKGGAPGACGRNYVLRADGREEELAATAAVELAGGDRFVIETPGGGGYGTPDET